MVLLQCALASTFIDHFKVKWFSIAQLSDVLHGNNEAQLQH